MSLREGDILWDVWAAEPGGREFSGLLVAADLDEVLDAIRWAVVFSVRSLTPDAEGLRTQAMT